jgi:16S rRNA (cytosine1402-N4)-methyltransferase
MLARAEKDGNLLDRSFGGECRSFLMNMELPSTGHDPVLLTEVLDLLAVTEGKTVVDCTLGRAGHSSAMAMRLGASGTLISMDADPRNLEFAAKRLEGVPCQLRLFHANFAELEHVLTECQVGQVDAILADLGLSTNQLFDPQYGLSFGEDSPLDMRIDPRTPLTAADVVNRWPEEKLANLLFEMAQERGSRRIARRIVQRRKASPFRTTAELAQVIYEAIGHPNARDKIDPATRTFMALRMAVNSEIENLQRLLEVAPRWLKNDGRLGIISFHSTEDRLVKQAFRAAEQVGHLQAVTKKPVVPTDDEMARNPRSRSAKLRVARRTSGQ